MLQEFYIPVHPGWQLN